MEGLFEYPDLNTHGHSKELNKQRAFNHIECTHFISELLINGMI